MDFTGEVGSWLGLDHKMKKFVDTFFSLGLRWKFEIKIRNIRRATLVALNSRIKCDTLNTKLRI